MPASFYCNVPAVKIVKTTKMRLTFFYICDLFSGLSTKEGRKSRFPAHRPNLLCLALGLRSESENDRSHSINHVISPCFTYLGTKYSKCQPYYISLYGLCVLGDHCVPIDTSIVCCGIVDYGIIEFNMLHLL